MSKQSFEWNDMAESLRLPDPDADGMVVRRGSYVGVTGTLYSDREATVVLTTPGASDQWAHMDVEYAKTVVMMLVEVIRSAEAHNKKLDNQEKSE